MFNGNLDTGVLSLAGWRRKQWMRFSSI